MLQLPSLNLEAEVGAQVSAALAPIVLRLENMVARTNNHQSINGNVGGLIPLKDANGNAPPLGLFPKSVQTLRSLKDGTPPVRLSNHTRLSALLNFYQVLDPISEAVFPSPPGPLAAGPVGDAELSRLEWELRQFLGQLS